MKQILSTSEALVKKNVINRVTDVPGGISLNLTDIPVGAVLPEATPIGAPADGKRKPCKQAVITTATSTTVFEVATATNPFAVGDVIGTQLSGSAQTITGIVSASGIDTITVGVAIDAGVVGGFLYEMSGVTADASVLAAEADTVLKTAIEKDAASYVIIVNDAHVRADIAAGVVGSLYLATLPGVIEIKY